VPVRSGNEPKNAFAFSDAVMVGELTSDQADGEMNLVTGCSDDMVVCGSSG
jgi:hypothetical protein